MLVEPATRGQREATALQGAHEAVPVVAAVVVGLAKATEAASYLAVVEVAAIAQLQ